MSDFGPVRQPHDFIVAAVHLLDYAVAGDDVRRALQALTELGRAAEARAWRPFLDAGDKDTVRLRELAASAPELLARAASAAASTVRRYGEDGVVDALYARSGYQTLLDHAIWPQPERGAGDFADVDDDLADELADLDLSGVRPPPVVPTTHTWWSLLS